ncbi:MAG: polysaccharide deacetylase family protein [Gemmatimonadota bacterium]
MKSFVKHAVERILVGAGYARAVRPRRAGRLLILAYHNVVPDEDAAAAPDSLHLPLSRFRKELDLLERASHIVALESPDSAGSVEPRGKPRVALTFDDAYREAVELALPELLRRELPATVFLCPGLLDAERFWWDVFDARGAEGKVFQELAGDDGDVSRFLAGDPRRRKSSSEWRRPARMELLSPYLRDREGAIRFGSHSWSHRNLAALEEDRLRDDLRSSWDWLERSVERPSRWLACPYGFNSPAVGRIAAGIGYWGALEIAGGWVPESGWDPFRTPRLNIPAGVSDEGFELRVSGVVQR